jgi:CheY-like chemotaxis protein
MISTTCVLFIDDDVLSLQLMSRISDLLGFEAIISTSAQRGLEMAARQMPALIIVDMQMDEMNGVEFVRQVRGLPKLARLPVLLCSAGMSPNDQDQARQAGADGFLMKPVGLNMLQETVQKYAGAV